MNRTNIFLSILILSLILTSCKKEDSKTNTEVQDNYINGIQNLPEPPNYDPEVIGEPTVSTETISGVEYKKIITKYKYAQKFDNKTQVSFLSDKCINDDNDIFLGAIIQGKYWRETGDLISIGDFDRNNLTITISGIDIDGSNSVEANPTKADMTDAINNLTSTNIFTANTNNYSFINKIAYSKQQLGLSLGLHPAWMDNIGFDFSINNTTETSTVYVYFKQIYYTISAKLPAQPSDFFTDKVDLNTLKKKMSDENPSGYISSIDYGRVVVVKMTSSQKKNDMKAAIGAVFGALNTEVSAEYKNIINNSSIEARIYGGSSSNVITSLDETINFINNGIEISNLQDAVPINYHIHYLDGSSFNTGDEIEFTETNYSISSASTMKVTRVTFTQLPHMQQDYWDDWSAYPDVYLNISKWDNTEWVNVASYSNNRFDETTSTNLDNLEVFWDVNLNISNFDKIYSFESWDYDSSADDQLMGYVNFTVNDDIINSGVYPTSKTLYDSNTGVRIELYIEWLE